MAGLFNTKELHKADQFTIVNDEKLRLSMMSLADQWNDFARSMIYETYNDIELLTLYKNARSTGAFEKGWKDKSHREVMRFPNGYVYNFCKAVFEPQYGPDWMLEKKIWSHELIHPWMLIDPFKNNRRNDE